MPRPPHLVDPLQLVDAPPTDEYALLELSIAWEGLAGVEAQLASALRLFVITRDPLDWLPDRGSAWATANADGDALELPVYVTLHEVRRRRSVTGGDLVAAVAQFGEAAVLSAVSLQGVVLAGAYPEMAARSEVPDLLTSERNPPRLLSPEIATPHGRWEPIGLGAVQDLVQQAFGPVDFDRSLVTLDQGEVRRPGCPACAGGRFGFPGELAEARAMMCGPHRSAGDEITTLRIAQARASNPAGWRAIAKGSARVSGTTEPAATPIPERHERGVRRNDPCPCGSGRKYKHCCGR